MKKITQIIYLAGVVVKANNLKKFVNSNMINEFCHHMTVKYGNIDKLPKELGMKFKFISDKVYFDDKAIAISGNPDSELIKKIMEETKQSGHITICTADGVAPVYSNQLLKTGSSIEYHDEVTLKFGAFVKYEDDTTGWVYKFK